MHTSVKAHAHIFHNFVVVVVGDVLVGVFNVVNCRQANTRPSE